MILFSFIIVMSAGMGGFFQDLYNHFLLDGFFLAFFSYVGYLIIKNPCDRSRVWILFGFYYLLLACFMDGNAGGWKHTEDPFSKVALIVINIIIYTMTVVVPLFILLIAFIHNQVIKFICKRCSEETNLQL